MTARSGSLLTTALTTVTSGTSQSCGGQIIDSHCGHQVWCVCGGAKEGKDHDQSVPKSRPTIRQVTRASASYSNAHGRLRGHRERIPVVVIARKDRRRVQKVCNR